MRKVMAMGAAALVLVGCSVRVNKDASGDEKDVHVSVPFGHVDVHKNPADAASLGMPMYPGAVPASDKKDKSADVSLGFGDFKLRVQAAEYVSSDPREKVLAFYKKALAQYGAVLTCRGNAPVGEPTRTGQGLECRDGSDHGKVASGDLELKAGSQRRQHLVAFDEKKPGTHFALVALELPQDGAGHGENTKGEQ